jgi:hypothetical protein
VGAGTAIPKAVEVLDLLREDRPGSNHRERVRAIRRVIEYVMALATEPEEEERPWWR